MVEKDDSVEKTSRRDFTKTIAAALVAAPVVASMAARGDSKPSDGAPSPQPSPTTKAEGDAGDRSHGPPIIIDDGSLVIDLPDELHNDTSGTILARKRVTKGINTHIAFIQVVTEREKVVETVRYPTSGDLASGHRLRISLDMKPDNSSTGDRVVSLIIVSGSPYSIESTKKLKDKEQSNKKFRPHRHKFPETAGYKISIGKWELLPNASETPVHSGENNGSIASFRILVTFSHP